MGIVEDFITELEGVRNKVYRDSAGKLTIGIGHLLSLEEQNRESVFLDGEYVSYKNGLTDEQIERLFEQDLLKYKSAVLDGVRVEVDINQFAALVSFWCNEGICAFQGSTLL